MTTRRFRGLSERQTDVLGQIALGNDGGHNPRTLAALEARGFIVPMDVPSRIPGVLMTVRHYEVPTWLHMEWCAWCSDMEAANG